MLREEVVEDGFPRERGHCAFRQVSNQEVEEELSAMATLAWAEGVWMGRWRREQQKARWKQICEVQTWSVTAGNWFHVRRDMWKQLWV